MQQDTSIWMRFADHIPVFRLHTERHFPSLDQAQCQCQRTQDTDNHVVVSTSEPGEWAPPPHTVQLLRHGLLHLVLPVAPQLLIPIGYTMVPSGTSHTTIPMPSINSIKHKGIGLEPWASFSIEVNHANATQKQIYDLMWSWMLDSKKPSSKCSTPTQPFFILLLLGCQNSMHTSVENLFKTIVRQNSKMNLMVFA